MRCYCCNKLLTTQEATRKFKTSGDYTDMCTECLHTIDDEVEYTKGRILPDEEEESEWDER